ncbi:MAG: glycosyltransferase family 4 protein [Microbacterium sp.]|uniref:glycosyltransferase family 4 protein n=1 Tax=Microbacterium sp. TaxID=51671 RepID=UPI003BB03C45
MLDAGRNRVALIASSFAPHIGGVEEHVAQVARGLSERGHSVEVWAVDRGERPIEPFGHGVEVRYLPAPLPARSLGRVANFLWCVPGAWRLWSRALRQLKPDVLHVHCFGPNGLYALALHLRSGTRLIVTSHGETNGDDTSVFDRSALLRRGLRVALRRAVAATAPTEFVLRDLRDRFGLEGGIVVPNGVALDVEPAAVPTTGRYITAVRRLGRMKGIDLLLDAFALARDDGRLPSGVRLLVAGDGPERSRLEAQVHDLGLKDRVEMLGWRTPSEVAGLVGGAEAMVVPSRSEAFGIAALEAWRAGTALIMTSRGGAAEFMHDGEDALLVDPQDAGSLAAAIVRVVTDDGLREHLASVGRERVGEFTWDRVTSMYQDIYARSGDGEGASR